MKSLKELLAELEQPKPEEEKRFKELHNIEKVDYVIPQEHVFKGTVDRTPRLADGGSDEKYDTSYVGKEPAKPIKEDAKLDGRRKEFKEKLKNLLYSKMRNEKKVAEDIADQLVTHMDEDAAEEIPMMEKQLAFISYAADEISEYVKKSGDPEEWYQNKLAEAHGSIKSLYAYAQGEMNLMGEEVELEEETEEDLDTLFEAAMNVFKEPEIAEGDKEEYEKFFKAALKKFGVSSPAELKGDKEKEFYNYIDKNWKADNEETETPKKESKIVSGVLAKRGK